MIETHFFLHKEYLISTKSESAIDKVGSAAKVDKIIITTKG